MSKRRSIYSLVVTALILAVLRQSVLAQSLEIEIDGEIFRDPTQPPNAVIEQVETVSFEEVPRISLSDFSLSFVRSGGINPVAVINDRTLTEGDEIDGVSVAEIRPGAVVLIIDGEEQVLNLFSRPVRQAIE